MNKTLSLIAAASLLPFLALADEPANPAPAEPAVAAPATTANGVRIDGAEIGQWTHDWDAALALAKEKDVPVFALFTGSDWCPYCVKLHDRIFAKDGWKNWAKDNVVLAYVDQPRDESLVPEKYRERNRQLCERYSIEGFPTALLLSLDTDEPLMTYGYDNSDTPESFAKDVADFLPLARHDGIKKSLSEEDWALYTKAQEERKSWEAKGREFLAKIQPKFAALQKEGKSREEIQEALKDDVEEMKKIQSGREAAVKSIQELMDRAMKSVAGEAPKAE